MNIQLTNHKMPKNGLQAISWHVDFEQVHPFADGNGRIGRILYLWHCDNLGIEPVNFGKENRDAYYDIFP